MVANPLALELQTCGCWELNLGTLEEQPVLLLQSRRSSLWLLVCWAWNMFYVESFTTGLDQRRQEAHIVEAGVCQGSWSSDGGFCSGGRLSGSC